ncbi:MAG: ABC transporter permease [Chloroflexales bacterium]|nr:ABC transporter permease [Chloroflexales bacterium]
MNILESFRVALLALRTNKLRSFLTMLGIIIGVGAVIGMLAMGNGFSNFLDDQFDQLGIGTFYIIPFVDSNKVDVATSAQLTAADARAIMEPGAAPVVQSVVIEYNDSATVSAGQERLTYPIRAATPNHFSVNANELALGRLYTDSEETERARVAVLGRNVAERLFGNNANAIGQRINLNGVGFEVIGVLATEQGSVSVGGDPAESIFIPYQTGISRLYRNQISSRIDVAFLTVKVQDPSQVEEAIKQVETVLRERHRLTYQDSDFTMLNPAQFAEQVGAIVNGFNAFLGIVAGISLLVGGIGIMNIMLVSVTERTREIGLRKAVGARRRDILLQFLIEALVLCLFGSGLGILLGYLLSGAGTLVLVGLFQAEGAQAMVTIDGVLLATFIAAAIGVFFGFFPALQAARLNPIEALRTE